MQKSKKIANFPKFFFSLETTLNALKFVCNTICAVHEKISGRYLSKKKLVIFQEIYDPGYAKK